MPTREGFAIGEFYHIYNRGVDKRQIVADQADSNRFIDCLKYFNTKEPIKSLRNLSPSDKIDILEGKTDPLVEIVCLCLNPNHYHLLLKEIGEGGISEFLKRLGGGYTWYFNNRYLRSGALFQGKFKSVRVESNEQLIHLSAYINLNDQVHQYSGRTAVLVRSSWGEYLNPENKSCFCNKEIILGQFRNTKRYQKFAEASLEEIIKSKIGKATVPEWIVGQHFF